MCQSVRVFRVSHIHVLIRILLQIWSIQQINSSRWMRYGTRTWLVLRLIDTFIVQYAEHAKLENLFLSSLSQLQRLRRQRLAVGWLPRKLKVCFLLLHAVPDYWNAHRITVLYCSAPILGPRRRNDRLSPNTWAGAESLFCRYLRFWLWLRNSDNDPQWGQDFCWANLNSFIFTPSLPHLQFASYMSFVVYKICLAFLIFA